MVIITVRYRYRVTSLILLSYYPALVSILYWTFHLLKVKITKYSLMPLYRS